MASPPEIKITVCGKTDVGLLREHNEDTFLVVDFASNQRSSPDSSLEFSLGEKGALFLVCDGMGGAAAGEVASTMAVESISSAIAEAGPLSRDRFARRLRRAIERANDQIFVQSRDNQSERGMGTTCTAVGLVDETLLVGQIGDSRCYVLRDGRLSQVTKDQSLAWQLIESGAMTLEEAKGFEHANIILQALGVQEKVEVVLSHVPLRRGDTVVVCSDGLHGPVTDDDIKQILLEEPDVQKACTRLIARANEHEGPDNITVVVARFAGADLPEPGPNDQVSFWHYDPGQDAEDPEPALVLPPTEKVTTENVPPKEQRATQPEMDTVQEATALPGLPAVAGATAAQPASSEARPLLTFVLLVLLAALAGAIFLIAQRKKIPDRQFDQASLATNRPTAPAIPAAIEPPTSPTDAGP
jgi:protein phosphatase